MNDNFSKIANARPEIVDLVPAGAHNKVLDIGCGWGDVGLSIKKRCNCEVTGIEFDPKRAEEARAKLDKVIMGDVEVLDLPFEEGYFDCIVFADVLEHLKDPLKVIKRYLKYMKDTGIIIASIPNIRHMKVLYDLAILGRWEYKEYGLLDEGHLRFFTRDSITKLIKDADLDLMSMESIFSIKGSKLINLLTLGLLKDFLTAQYVCRAVKSGESVETGDIN